VDPSNGQLAHWAGLNLSRTWMMAAIADALTSDRPLVAALRAGAATHSEVGLSMADHDAYMVSHWVPTFALFLVTDAAGRAS